MLITLVKFRNIITHTPVKGATPSLSFGETLTAVISILAFVVPSIVAVIPLLLNPILDYSVRTISTNNTASTETMNVIINNFGVTSAKNIIISMTAANTDFTFAKSTPFLYDKFNENLSNSNAFFSIDNLPPNTQTSIMVVAKTNMSKNEPLITYVRSDETTGKVNVSAAVVFYVLLFLILGGSYLSLIKSIPNAIIWKNLVYFFLITIGYIIIFTMLYQALFNIRLM
jgi:hypothetical protein